MEMERQLRQLERQNRILELDNASLEEEAIHRSLQLETELAQLRSTQTEYKGVLTMLMAALPQAMAGGGSSMMRKDSSGGSSAWDKKRRSLMAHAHQEEKEELLAAGVAAMRRVGSTIRVGRVCEVFASWQVVWRRGVEADAFLWERLTAWKKLEKERSVEASESGGETGKEEKEDKEEIEQPGEQDDKAATAESQAKSQQGSAVAKEEENQAPTAAAPRAPTDWHEPLSGLALRAVEMLYERCIANQRERYFKVWMEQVMMQRKRRKEGFLTKEKSISTLSVAYYLSIANKIAEADSQNDLTRLFKLALTSGMELVDAERCCMFLIDYYHIRTLLPYMDIITIYGQVLYVPN